MDSYYHAHDLGKFADMRKSNKALWEKFKGYKGASVEEITEAVHVACATHNGSSLVHGVQMRNVAEKLSM